MSHTSFCAASDAERRAMLEAVGAKSFDDLFVDVPKEYQTESFNVPEGRSELEVMQSLRGLAARNSGRLINFCGAGFYDHFIPAAVDSLAGRGEFYTAYTPYQPECSQGTLQAIYEWQTAITRLTDMEVANASLYDGGTALFEGLMMALRITGRNRVLVDEGVSPIYRTMLRCYTRNLSIEYEEIPMAAGVADRDAFQEKLEQRRGRRAPAEPELLRLSGRLVRPGRGGARGRRARRVLGLPALARTGEDAGRDGRRHRHRRRPEPRPAALVRRPVPRLHGDAEKASSAKCRAASSAPRRTRRAAADLFSRSRRENSTSAARKRCPTSARTKRSAPFAR